MKTNQIMIREEGFIQRTSDGYFNANTLVDVWNSKNQNQKQLGQFKLLTSTIEYIEQLKKEGIETPIITGRGSGANAGTWMHPKMFIDLCMWVSVEFKSKVIDMVLDRLIISRHEAGDYYKEMCATIMTAYVDQHGCKPPATIYIDEANLIKDLVSPIDRNNMTESELRQVTYLQKFNSMLFKKGIGKDSRIRQLTQANEVIY